MHVAQLIIPAVKTYFHTGPAGDGDHRTFRPAVTAVASRDQE
jgi:hypothetical protein